MACLGSSKLWKGRTSTSYAGFTWSCTCKIQKYKSRGDKMRGKDEILNVLKKGT